MPYYQLLRDNSLTTKADLREAFRQLTSPLAPLYSEGGARLQIRGAGAGHGEDVGDMEGFSRVLWGLIPYLAGKGEPSALWKTSLKGIVNGTNPEHPEYWGEVNDYDQRLVEMAAIGLALCLVPQLAWEPLGESEKSNLYRWLNQINDHPCHDCNWLFFQVMVNLGFRQIGEPYDAEQMARNLDRLDAFYMDDGWYRDGIPGHCDYYVPFAFHYYGLIYATFMKQEDPERCARYRERSLLFAEQFLHWFAADGAALPYGRSLAYRFAQSAFWSALAYAGLYSEVLTPGVVKGLVLRNLRWWFDRPIFDLSGILTVGYAYPNLVMAENYNGPGSPYWAMKTFLVLALADDSAFWTAPEEAMPELAAVSAQPEPRLVVCREPDSKHVVAFNNGHHHSNEHTHTSAKYEKFAYSTHFGFSVPRAEWGHGQAAPDSMLALSENDNLFRMRRKNEETWMRGNVLYAKWKPWVDVQAESWIVAGLPWHMRVHRIRTERSLHAAEGGFAIGLRNDQQKLEQAGGIGVSNELGRSETIGLIGYASAQLSYPNANTNVLEPRTVLPTLHAQLASGEHVLASLICGQAGGSTAVSKEQALAALHATVAEHEIKVVNCEGETIIIPLR